MDCTRMRAGAIGACEAACAFIRDTFLADEDPEWTAKVINLDVARCSRLDLFPDWQGGWHPPSRLMTSEHSSSGSGARRGRPRQVRIARVNGYEIGSLPCVDASTTKPSSARRSMSSGYPTLLQERNRTRYDTELDLWRLEFQLRRRGCERLPPLRQARDDPIRTT